MSAVRSAATLTVKRRTPISSAVSTSLPGQDEKAVLLVDGAGGRQQEKADELAGGKFGRGGQGGERIDDGRTPLRRHFEGHPGAVRAGGGGAGPHHRGDTPPAGTRPGRTATPQ